MSYTTILHVYPGDRVESGEELRNSWGSAPYLWDWLVKQYIDADGSFLFLRSNSEKLWGLWKSDIPSHQRAVLLMTFDRAYVAKANYARAAADIRLFLKDYNNSAVVNHWPRIAEIFEGNPDIPAIGLWLTSVSENPFSGPWDEDKEEYLPPDWDTCFEVYAKLDNLTKSET